MTEYSGNTNKKREEAIAKEDKKIERIVSGEIIIQKKSVGRKIKDVIIASDMRGVGRYLWWDILVPAARNMIVDTVEQGVKRTVYGDTRASRYSRDPRVGQSRVTYNQPVLSRPYPGRDPRPDPVLDSGSRRASTNSARGFIISSRQEAEQVLEMMANIIDRYEVVTVAELNEMLGLESEYVDQRWGWTDIRTAHIRQIREGWILELPDADGLPG